MSQSALSSRPLVAKRRTPKQFLYWCLLVLVVVFVAALAWLRMGLLDLPRIPSSVTVESAGLADLSAMKELHQYVFGRTNVAEVGELIVDPGKDPKRVARNTMRDCVFKVKLPDVNEASGGLNEMRIGIGHDPENVVLQNAYRLVVFSLRRDYLIESRKRGQLTPDFPPHLDRQPIAFFEELAREHPSRETKLQHALAWVDEMLLFPALEIKAPSSVQSVDILTEILSEPGNEYYVPALFARGLNHLHRPARLVWPESSKTPIDAAVQDIAKCVAIGRKLNVGSARLQGIMALTLGDAYVKAGRFGVARSWWQIAQNICHDDGIQQAVRRRYEWDDEEILDRLEEELDRARTNLEQPMTDLAMMWN